MQWGWNHNPDTTRWSLTARPGFLRLTTGTPVSSLRDARNTLTQRLFANYDASVPTVVSTRMEVSNMRDGDVAGLALFQDPFAYIGVKQVDGKRYIIMENHGLEVASVPLEHDGLYLRATARYDTGEATFSYSFDNKTFTPLGDTLKMRFALTVFTGNKVCLFNYATRAPGGYVDFDWLKQ